MLLFPRGPTGYKTRCPSCGAVVRLRTDPAGGTPPPLPSPEPSNDGTPPDDVLVVELVPLAPAPRPRRRRWLLLYLALLLLAAAAGVVVGALGRGP